MAGLRLIFGLLAWLSAASAAAAEPVLNFPEQEVRANRPITLRIRPPEGFKINEAAPNRVMLVEGSSGRIVRVWQTGTIRGLEIPLGTHPPSDGAWTLRANLFICAKKDARVCVTRKVLQNFRVSPRAKSSTLHWTLDVPAGAEDSSPGSSSVR